MKPLAFKPEQINHDFHWFVVVVAQFMSTIARANADMDAVTRHIAEVYPKSDKGWGASVELLKTIFGRDYLRSLAATFGRRWLGASLPVANVVNGVTARHRHFAKRQAVAGMQPSAAPRAGISDNFWRDSVPAHRRNCRHRARLGAIEKITAATMPPSPL